jgi:hypothetical protein
MGWKMVDTVRCSRCDVFTPTDDMLYASDGSTYCGACGPPPISIAPIFRVSRFDFKEMKRHPFFVACAAVALIVTSSFVAAFASQL